MARTQDIFEQIQRGGVVPAGFTGIGGVERSDRTPSQPKPRGPVPSPLGLTPFERSQLRFSPRNRLTAAQHLRLVEGLRRVGKLRGQKVTAQQAKAQIEMLQRGREARLKPDPGADLDVLLQQLQGQTGGGIPIPPGG